MYKIAKLQPVLEPSFDTAHWIVKNQNNTLHINELLYIKEVIGEYVFCIDENNNSIKKHKDSVLPIRLGLKFNANDELKFPQQSTLEYHYFNKGLVKSNLVIVNDNYTEIITYISFDDLLTKLTVVYDHTAGFELTKLLNILYE